MFQSTHSLRSATGILKDALRVNNVSIHALLAECDRASSVRAESIQRFNPRTPCGVRPAKVASGALSYEVSIHALLAECD